MRDGSREMDEYLGSREGAAFGADTQTWKEGAACQPRTGRIAAFSSTGNNALNPLLALAPMCITT